MSFGFVFHLCAWNRDGCCSSGRIGWVTKWHQPDPHRHFKHIWSSCLACKWMGEHDGTVQCCSVGTGGGKRV